MPVNLQDPVSRGQYGPSPFGTGLFILLRILDGFIIQRVLQVLNPIAILYKQLGWPIPLSPQSGEPLITLFGQQLHSFEAVIWGMAMVFALKHVFWVLYTSKEQMTPDLAVLVGVGNCIFHTINTLAFTLARNNPMWSSWLVYVSIPLFAVGVLLETVSEVQRKWFKDDPRNKGKPYAGGLFGYARSINYFGYTVSRGGAALAGGGWGWAALIMSFATYDFTGRAIPAMDEYCSKRYGRQWEEVKRKVPYGFFPGVC